MIDFVGDHANTAVGAIVDQRLHRAMIEHCAGGVRRAGDDQAIQRTGNPIQKRGSWLKSCLRRPLQRHRLDPKGGQYVPVAGISRLNQSDAVTRIKRGEERQNESARRSGRNRDPLHWYLHAVPIADMPCHGLAQRRNAKRIGIAKLIGIKGAVRCRLDPGRSRRAGLTDFHMDHISLSGLPFVGSPHHIHYDKRRYGPA